MQKFRKKPVEIEAYRFLGSTKGPKLAEWCGGTYHEFTDPLDETKICPVIEIQTLEGSMFANKGDWIIKGIQGEFYPCKNDIFIETYDPVVED